MDENELEKALNECKKTAKVGYKIATAQEKNLNRTLRSAQKEVQSTINDFNSSPCYAPETSELLDRQLRDIKDSLSNLSFVFREDLQNLHDNLSKFSITLFGRTMAGKSTLMEILTEGDGTSIGKGAQRTTRDVRKYNWNGMEITDVPGIGAFEGEEDENIAFEAAKMADLILFLITDDAPQIAEAGCFSKIVNLGKPIICIINVKAAIAENKSIKLAIRDINKRFDMERLNKIRNQFLLFADQFGQTWSHVPFVYVHLKSAYLAQCTEDQERKIAYYEISKIEYLKRKIVEQVRMRGEFYRIKTFIDVISNPTLESIESLLEQSQLNIIQGRTVLEKKRQLENWMISFESDGKSQIWSLITKINSELNGEIASFAEDHFDDKNADKAWNALLKTRRIEVRCQELLNSLEEKCNNKIKEISREITRELKFSATFSGDKSLKMDKILDGKKIWNWSTLTIGGGLSIAAGIAYFVGAASAGPIGWAALIVSAIGIVGSVFFKSRDEKEREARIKLENNLKTNVSKMCKTLKSKMEENLELLVNIKIKDLLKAMDKINSVVVQLADTQKKLAWELNPHLMELNSRILEEAIKLIGADGLQYHILSVARIPGNVSMIKLNDGTVFPKEQIEELHKLMSERIYFVYNTDNKKILISRVIGKEIDRNLIRIEEKIGVAYVPLKNITQNTKIRVRLAQQFSELLIMNR